MTFDINRLVSDPETGEYNEEAGYAYQGAILDLFAESPEGQAHMEQGRRIVWTSMFLEYAMSYLGLTPPEMGEGDLREVLFELFPRKVSVGPEEAPDIIEELRVFWGFLERAYGLPNAPAMLRLLDDNAARRLERELGNPANFGMAKSIIMQGQASGFDTTTQEGLDAWMHAYNAGLGAPPPLSMGAPAAPRPPGAAQRSGDKARKEKQKRKMARASRKQNRRK